jgi:hypothetical protein
MQQSQDETSPGCAEGMTQSNRTAIDVRSFTIETQFLFNCEVLRGERFIDFNQVNVRKFQACFLKRLASSRDRSDPHDLRLDSGVSPANDATQWLYASSFDEVLAGNNQRGRAIDYA